MFPCDRGDALLPRGQDVEPQKNSPHTVLFAHMVRAGAGAFLAADRRHAGIEKVAEEFPAGRGLVELDAEPFGNAIGGAAGGHRACDAGDSLGISGRQMGVGGEHRQTVGGRDEQAAADDQVAVAVTVGGGAQIGRGRRHRQIVKMLGIDEIGVGMVAAEIGQRRAVDDGAGRGAQSVFSKIVVA